MNNPGPDDPLGTHPGFGSMVAIRYGQDVQTVRPRCNLVLLYIREELLSGLSGAPFTTTKVICRSSPFFWGQLKR